MKKLLELGVGAGGPGRRPLELAHEAERRGFDWLWTADANGTDAFASAGAIAAVTTRPKIGTAVALRVRSPLQTVFACATLEELTGGKFTFGIGAGPSERIEAWHGLEHSPAVGRMREYITVLRLLWESSPAAPVTYEGRFYSVTDYGRPAPSAYKLPIFLGCAGTLMTRLAGELADGLIVHVLHSPKMLQEHTLPALEAGAKRGGRTLDGFKIGAGIFTAVDADRAVALNRIRHQIIWALNVPYNRPLLALAGFPGVTETILASLDRGDKAAALAAIPEELVHEVALCGTPDDIRKRLDDWSELLDFASFNGIGAYMNVAPEDWRLPADELLRNREAIFDLLPLPVAGRDWTAAE